MRFSTTLLAAVLALVSAAPSNPKFLTFPLTKHQESDLSKKSNTLLHEESHVVPITNQQTYYSIAVGLGTPAQNFNLLLDTGSSDLWVFNVSDTSDCVNGGCKQTGQFDAKKSSTFDDIHEEYFIQYVKGNATGSFVKDTLSVGDIKLPDFQFAVADHASGNTGTMGVAGPSQEALKKGESVYPNFPIALQQAGYIDRRVYSLYLDDAQSKTGTFLLGGIDHAKFKGDLNVLPLSDPRAFFVNYTSISYDGETLNKKEGKAVLDSGTSLTYVPDDVYNAFSKKANLDGSLFFGLPTVDCSLDVYLDFEFNGKTIRMEKESLVINMGVLGFCMLGLESSIKSDNITILGDTFLRSAYVAYDLEDQQIGIAQAVHTNATDIRPVTGPLSG